MYKAKLKLPDTTIFACLLLLASIGLCFVYSATNTPLTLYSRFFVKQTCGVISGLVLYAFVFTRDTRTLQVWGYWGYIATLALLCFTTFKGTVGLGAQRWISLGFITFQPSELAKLFFPPFFVYHIRNRNHEEVTSKHLAVLGCILAANCLLILKQPDLGTAVVVGLSGVLLMWLAGIGKRILAAGLCLATIGAPIGWRFLKPYQKRRVTVFLGGGTPHKERYQIEQSQIAVGSGGIWGKGFLHGTQNHLHFLPESRTDFIFAVICEECGFIGALCVLLLFACLFGRCFICILRTNNAYDQLLATGLLLPIVIATIVNIGMVIGVMPIVGIPLPFITYGITHMWISIISLGWICNLTTPQRRIRTS